MDTQNTLQQPARKFPIFPIILLGVSLVTCCIWAICSMVSQFSYGGMRRVLLDGFLGALPLIGILAIGVGMVLYKKPMPLICGIGAVVLLLAEAYYFFENIGYFFSGYKDRVSSLIEILVYLCYMGAWLMIAIAFFLNKGKLSNTLKLIGCILLGVTWILSAIYAVIIRFILYFYYNVYFDFQALLSILVSCTYLFWQILLYASVLVYNPFKK